MVAIGSIVLLLCLNLRQTTAAAASTTTTRPTVVKSSTTPLTPKTTASCQAALRECSLFGVDVASLDGVYQQAFAALLQKQRLEYQHNLVRARDFLINLINRFILNPDLPPDPQACQGADTTAVTLLNDPIATLPSLASVPDVTVKKLEQCQVSDWSSWSNPFAFGVIERRRTVLQQGTCCPDNLVQQVNVTAYIGSSDSVFQNTDNVGTNFHNDFLNKEPRDILIIIDTSSSIFIEDFEFMKQGINSMIDLFCGGFGPDAKQNRLAIMQFSDRPHIVHYFNESQAPADLRKKVQAMEDFGGRTCTGDALLEAYDQIFRLDRGVRANTPNDTLLVTDGHANCGSNLLEAAQRLQQRSKSVYALGIAIAKDPAARAQVTSVVSNEDPHHIFALERYVEFKDMITFIRDKQQGKPCVPIVGEQ